MLNLFMARLRVGCVSPSRAPFFPAPITSKRMPRRPAIHKNARQNHYPRGRQQSQHALSGLLFAPLSVKKIRHSS